MSMYIKHGREQGKARVLYDGNTEAQKHFPTQEGFWVPPVIFTDCTDDMRITQEEIFGPIMCILPYKTRSQGAEWLPDLVRRANNNPTGLTAGVVSVDIGLAQRAVQQLEAGITWINKWGESPAEMPVRGWKMSGMGLENGIEGIQAYLRKKCTLVQCTKGACKRVFPTS